MKKLANWVFAAASLAFCLSVQAQNLTVQMHLTAKHGIGKSIGSVTVNDTPYGLLIIPNLHGLPPGLHGFHVHTNPSCGDIGKAAGGHLDPEDTDKHLGPYNSKGHLGDLPALYVNSKGDASLPILAPRLKAEDLKAHSLMIHLHGDNYADVPAKLGGGGPRIACGVIETPKPPTTELTTKETAMEKPAADSSVTPAEVEEAPSK